MNPDDVDDMDFPLPIVAQDDFSNLNHNFSKMKLVSEDNSETKNWIVVYPIYFDKKRTFYTRGGGRKVNQSLASQDVTSLHVLMAARKLNLELGFEPTKRHPKDFFNFGRVRVNLTLSNGFYAREDIMSKKQLLVAIAKLIPEAQKEDWKDKDVEDRVDGSDLQALMEAATTLLGRNYSTSRNTSY